jgi:hypothetical protein
MVSIFLCDVAHLALPKQKLKGGPGAEACERPSRESSSDMDLSLNQSISLASQAQPLKNVSYGSRSAMHMKG